MSSTKQQGTMLRRGQFYWGWFSHITLEMFYDPTKKLSTFNYKNIWWQFDENYLTCFNFRWSDVVLDTLSSSLTLHQSEQSGSEIRQCRGPSQSRILLPLLVRTPGAEARIPPWFLLQNLPRRGSTRHSARVRRRLAGAQSLARWSAQSGGESWRGHGTAGGWARPGWWRLAHSETGSVSWPTQTVSQCWCWCWVQLSQPQSSGQSFTMKIKFEKSHLKWKQIHWFRKSHPNLLWLKWSWTDFC